LSFPWHTSYLLGTGLGGGQKERLQRAATARTVDGKSGQRVRRHSLVNLNASMIKQKKAVFAFFVNLRYRSVECGIGCGNICMCY